MSADSAVLPFSSRLLRTLRVERQELRPTLLLALFLLMGMAAVICLKAVSDAVFLSEFDATRLPYVDLVVTLLVGVLINYYLSWSARLALGSLVSKTQTVLAASILVLWLLLWANFSWAPILLYLWVGVFAILIPSQVWSLSAATFTTRQAKRLFTVIGAGGILGAAVGGSFTGFFGPRIGAASVLPVAASLLFGGAWIARAITTGRRQDLTSPSPEKDKAPILESARLVRVNRYLLLIALAIVASTVVGTLVKYQFKAVAQAYFEAYRDGLASFAGYFYGYVSVISFLFHATLSTRILRWIGPSFALFVLPMAMLSGVVGLLFSASIFAAIWARGADQGFRDSIDRASSELLWMPIASDLRNRVKSFMDIVVSRGADGLASVVLLAMLYLGEATIQHVSWASLVFLFAWLLVLWTLRGEYIQTLRTTIERRDISAEQLLQRLAASGPSNELETGLGSSDAQDVEVAAGLAQFSNAKAAQSQLASLLVHESGAVRRKAMTTIASLQAKGCEREVAAFLRLETDFDSRHRAFDYLDPQDSVIARETEESLLQQPDQPLAAMAAARLMKRPDYPSQADALYEDIVVTFSEGGPTEQVQAAQLLGLAPIKQHRSDILSALLDSPEQEVVRAAIRSTGALRQTEDLPKLVLLLAERRYGTETRQAITAYGEQAIAALSAALRDDSAAPRLQRQAARVLGSIGGRLATQSLLAHLRRSREIARPDVLLALGRIRDKTPDHDFNNEVVNLLLQSVLRRFYETVTLSAGMRDEAHAPAAKFLVQALRERQDRWLNEAFVLLGLVFPQREMRDAHHRIQSGRRDLRANALEFLDSRLIGSDIRAVLLPAVEEQTNRGILEAGRRLFQLDLVPYSIVLRRLLDTSDVWLQVCACHAAAESRQTACHAKITELTRHADPLLRETALAASARF